MECWCSIRWRQSFMLLAVFMLWFSSGACQVQNPINCDFESGTCNWIQDTSDNFDWSRNKGDTPTMISGPPTDHTKKTKYGYYMYIDSRDGLYPQDVARLLSQPMTVTGNKTFSVWIHKNGKGNVTLYIQYLNDTRRALWHYTNNTGDSWIQMKQGLPEGSYRLSIEGNTLNGLREGDTAIDDTALLDEFVSETTPRTTPSTSAPLPATADCHFDQNYCNYNLDISDHGFTWVRKKGSTDTWWTGPRGDHTTGSGYFMYLESSKMPVGEKIYMSTPYLAPTSGTCLSVWYHMRGRHIGALNVYIQKGGDPGAPVFSRQGDQGANWYQAKVNIESSTPYQMVFEAERGSGGDQGDIALDDVVFSPVKCPDPTKPTSPALLTLNCTFDSDMCGFTSLNRPSLSIHWSRTESHALGGEGAIVDHTSGKGFFLIADAGKVTMPGEGAVVSPVLKANHICLQFYYSIYGTSAQSLVVLQNGPDGEGDKRWEHDSNMEKTGAWRLQYVQMKSRTDFQFTFETLRGPLGEGFIAIDDVLTTEGNCPALTTPSQASTPTPSPMYPVFSCDFTKDMCGLTEDPSVKESSLYWRRGSGLSVQYFTPGSSSPKQEVLRGNFIYFNESTGKEVARIGSPSFKAGGTFELEFSYRILQQEANISTEFSVLVKEGLGVAHAKWKIHYASDTLRKGAVKFTPNEDFIIIFEVSHNDPRGFVLLANIKLIGSVQSPTAIVPLHPSTLSCTFDKGVCGFTQDPSTKTPRLFWKRAGNLTLVYLPQPLQDHTSGNGDFMYFGEAITKEQARLLSPTMKTVGTVHLEFYYRLIQNKQSAEFSVLVKEGVSDEHSVWKAKNVDEQWQKGVVDYSPTENDVYTIIFQVTENPYQGLVILDDVTLTASNGTTSPTPGIPQVNFVCDFDTDWCGLQQDSGESSSDVWQRGRVSPTGDHTTGEGQSVYFDPSKAKEKTKYSLVTPMIQVTGTSMCLDIFLQGELAVLNLIVKENEKEELLSPLQARGGDWQRFSVSFKPKSSVFQFIFETFVPENSQPGILAMDDISISQGECAPSTLSPTTPKPLQLNCTFDSGLCQYTQGINGQDDDLDWEIVSEAVSQGVTVKDHTSGSGNFVFLNNSWAEHDLRGAFLLSPLILNVPQQAYCFSFWYFLTPNTNPLIVFVTAADEVRLTNRVWMSSFLDDKPQWQKQEIHVVNRNGFQVAFMGEVTANIDNGAVIMALDDFSIQPGNCSVPRYCDSQPCQNGGTCIESVGKALCECTVYYTGINCGDCLVPGKCPTWPPSTTVSSTVHTPGEFSCSFTHNSLCGYTQSQEDEFDWSFYSTVNKSAGQDSAHDDYLFINVTAVKMSDARARLLSPLVNSPGSHCFIFWHLLDKATLDSINIYIKPYQEDVPVNPVYTVFSVFEGTDLDWERNEVYIDMNGAFQVVIEGVKAAEKKGMVAIDDVEILLGDCSKPSPCGSQPCKNGGTCIASAEGFLCECMQPKFTGKTCEIVATTSTLPPTTTVPPSLNCTFDSGSLCAYHQSGEDEFDWSFSTPGQKVVKPYSDHTTGNGSYLFINSSSRKTDDRAFLMSPEISSGGVHCFTFWFYLSGAVSDTLNVYMRPAGEEMPRNPVWTSFSSEESSDWWYEEVLLDMNGAFEVVVEGVRGLNGIGTVAIDDIGLQEGQCQSSQSCKPETCQNGGTCVETRDSFMCICLSGYLGTRCENTPTSPGTTPSTTPATIIDDVTCDFDQGYCGYKQFQQGQDEFDWSLSIPGNSNMNPRLDHSGNGSYIYVNMSQANSAGDRAKLISPLATIPASSPSHCLSFWYYLPGTVLDILNFYVVSAGAPVPTDPVWTLVDEGREQWVYQEIPINKNLGDFQIMFEGIRGVNDAGALAVDDIVLRKGNCTVPSPCDSNPCLNGATCIESTELYVCECTLGYIGINCGRIIPDTTTIVTTARASSTVTSPLVPQITSSVPGGAMLYCNFDNTWCDFTQDKADNFDWSMSSGDKDEVPNKDHTSGSGKYIYINTSRAAGDSARLLSPVVAFQGSLCLTFYLNMQSIGLSELNIYVKPSGGPIPMYPEWSVSFSEGEPDQWDYNEVNIKSRDSNQFQIVVEGVTGGDQVALDDLLMKTGTCTEPQYCKADSCGGPSRGICTESKNQFFCQCKFPYYGARCMQEFKSTTIRVMTTKTSTISSSTPSQSTVMTTKTSTISSSTTSQSTASSTAPTTDSTTKPSSKPQTFSLSSSSSTKKVSSTGLNTSVITTAASISSQKPNTTLPDKEGTNGTQAASKHPPQPSNVGAIVGATLGVAGGLFLAAIGGVLYIKKNNKGYFSFIGDDETVLQEAMETRRHSSGPALFENPYFDEEEKREDALYKW